MAKSQATIADTLRERVLRGIRAGTLEPGARLPSARELVGEFNVDSRMIVAAYKQLADDGLIEIRERGGVYVRKQSHGPGAETLPVKWFSETFAEGLARGFSSADLAEGLRRLVETVRIRAVVISSTEDQVGGLTRELHEDFGLVAEGFPAAVFEGDALHDAALRAADILIGTEGQAELTKSLAERFEKPHLIIDVKPDLIIGEWAMMLRQPVWAVVATAEFGDMLRRFFSGVRGVENLHILVHGRDDLAQIPLGAPTYVTHRVRQALGVATIRGNILPPARTISTASARLIFDFIVRANYRAQQVLHHAPAAPTDAGARRA
jgi:DNA-binding transcriptional regulator YhcF (GntR family)